MNEDWFSRQEAAATTAADGTTLRSWTQESEELITNALDYTWCSHPHGEEGISTFVYLAKGVVRQRTAVSSSRLWLKTFSYTHMRRVAVITGYVPFARWHGNAPLNFVVGSLSKGTICGMEYHDVVATVNKYRTNLSAEAYNRGYHFGCNTIILLRERPK